MTLVACLLYLVAAVVLFRSLPARRAILATYLGGLLLLPVGRFPADAVASGFPWWITGTAVPSSMLLVKIWAAPLVAFVGGSIVAPHRLLRWRPALIDAPMLGWCLWPCAGLLVGVAEPAPLVSAVYLSGTWGLPWLIGRVWFQERANQLDLAAALALAALACLPFALVEGVAPVRLYQFIYAPHPFAADGVVRYVGYRPLGFFEDGNQYGIWVALGALAATWMAATRGGGWRVVAAVTLAMALAAQSVGAIALLVAGIALIAGWRARWLRLAVAAAALLVVAVGAVHLSGVVPLQTIARQTRLGGEALELVRSTGRGSIAWRISQDTRTLAAVHDAPIAGAQRWDWFRPFGTRPWGLALLIIGQFGLVGFLLSFGTLAAAALLALRRSAGERPWRPTAVPLALGMIVLLALADALLNSFFYFPAILCAGAVTERGLRARRIDAAGGRSASSNRDIG